MSLTSSCPVCGGRQHDAVYAKQRVPRYLLERHFTRSAAIDAVTGDIDIRQCADCEFAFNRKQLDIRDFHRRLTL